jgi:hypothetical protein
MIKKGIKSLGLLALISLVMVGCSSTPKDHKRKLEERKHRDIRRDYTVTEASSNTRPGWIEDAEIWAHQNRHDVQSMRYFSFETEPKVSRQIACEIARANARGDIAGEITTFISRSLAQSQSGSAAIDPNNPQVQTLRNYVDSSLVERVQAMIHGSSVLKTYWERRNYSKKLGAKEDYTAFTCAVFVQMDRERLNQAVERASRLVIDEAGDPELKAKVETLLKEAKTDFERMRRGEI